MLDIGLLQTFFPDTVYIWNISPGPPTFYISKCKNSRFPSLETPAGDGNHVLQLNRLWYCASEKLDACVTTNPQPEIMTIQRWSLSQLTWTVASLPGDHDGLLVKLSPEIGRWLVGYVCPGRFGRSICYDGVQVNASRNDVDGQRRTVLSWGPCACLLGVLFETMFFRFFFQNLKKLRYS